jgi:hypothetical protein
MKQVDQPLGGIHCLDRLLQHDHADRINRSGLDHPGLVRLQINRVVKGQALATAGLLHSDRCVIRRRAPDRPHRVRGRVSTRARVHRIAKPHSFIIANVVQSAEIVIVLDKATCLSGSSFDDTAAVCDGPPNRCSSAISLDRLSPVMLILSRSRVPTSLVVRGSISVTQSFGLACRASLKRHALPS